MKKFLLNFSYDGTDFHGWQVQTEQRTIQATMENALEKIFKTETKLGASGRTDSGVHAINQYADFSANTKMKEINVINALNSLLPPSIFVKKCKQIPADFNARFSAKKRIYVYKINKNYNPFERNFTAFIPDVKIDFVKLKSASKYLIGKNDFGVFARDTSHLNNCICEIHSARWHQNDEKLYFHITSNRFLHNMVRRIVGTLIKISDQNLPDDHIKKCLETQNYSLLGDTAPPHGLYLENVEY